MPGISLEILFLICISFIIEIRMHSVKVKLSNLQRSELQWEYFSTLTVQLVIKTVFTITTITIFNILGACILHQIIT